MNKKTFLLTLFSTIYTVNSQAATSSEAPGGSSFCTAMPSCESLGYSKSISSDCENSLSCPFDTTWKICLDGTATRACAIGDIFYSDTSCSSTYDETKTPVGVVFMLTSTQGGVPISETTSAHGRVVNLHDLYAQSNYLFDATKPYSGSYPFLHWGLYGKSISNLTNYTTNSVTTSGSLGYALKNNVSDIYDGKSNTQKIIAAVSSTSCSYTSGTTSYAQYCRAPAAEAANAFYPPNVNADDPKVGAGQWYLPAEGELAYLYGIDTNAVTDSFSTSGATGTTKTTVNKTLSVLKTKLGSSYAATLTNSNYWSSSAVFYGSWILNMNNGYRYGSDRRDYRYVRAVLAF
jgi:hypothetical protein